MRTGKRAIERCASAACATRRHYEASRTPYCACSARCCETARNGANRRRKARAQPEAQRRTQEQSSAAPRLERGRRRRNASRDERSRRTQAARGVTAGFAAGATRAAGVPGGSGDSKSTRLAGATGKCLPKGWESSLVQLGSAARLPLLALRSRLRLRHVLEPDQAVSLPSCSEQPRLRRHDSIERLRHDRRRGPALEGER